MTRPERDEDVLHGLHLLTQVEIHHRVLLRHLHGIEIVKLFEALRYMFWVPSCIDALSIKFQLIALG